MLSVYSLRVDCIFFRVWAILSSIENKVTGKENQAGIDHLRRCYKVSRSFHIHSIGQVWIAFAIVRLGKSSHVNNDFGPDCLNQVYYRITVN